MPAATVDLDGDRIIEQGSYWSLEILYPGNVMGAYLRGQIRKGYGGEAIAELQLLQPDYDEDADKTRFTLFLRAGTTAKMPLPLNGEFWRYDVLLYLPNEDPRRLLQGKVFVSPGITNVGN